MRRQRRPRQRGEFIRRLEGRVHQHQAPARGRRQQLHGTGIAIGLFDHRIAEGGSGPVDPKVEVQKLLTLNVLITEYGFTIQSTLRGIEPSPAGDPNASISVKQTNLPPEDEHFWASKYDFKALNDKMVSLRKEAEAGGYSDVGSIQITAAEGIKYQLVVFTIDAVRYHYDKDREIDKELFPAVALGAAL